MSHGFGSVLPDRVLKMVDPRDRHLLKDQVTYDEAMSKAKVRVERDIHAQIEGKLNRLGIVYIHSRTDKPTTSAVGLPDFMFSVAAFANEPSIAVAAEVKLPGEDLSPDQERVRDAMRRSPNCWQYFVVRSYDDFLSVLSLCGL